MPVNSPEISNENKVGFFGQFRDKFSNLFAKKNPIEAFMRDPQNQSNHDALIRFVDNMVMEVNSKIQIKISQKKQELKDSGNIAVINNIKNKLEGAVNVRLKNVRSKVKYEGLSEEKGKFVMLNFRINYDEIVNLILSYKDVLNDEQRNKLTRELNTHIALDPPVSVVTKEPICINPTVEQISSRLILDCLQLKDNLEDSCNPGPEELSRIYGKMLSSYVSGDVLSISALNKSDEESVFAKLSQEYSKEAYEVSCNNGPEISDSAQKLFGRAKLLEHLDFIIRDRNSAISGQVKAQNPYGTSSASSFRSAGSDAGLSFQRSLDSCSSQENNMYC